MQDDADMRSRPKWGGTVTLTATGAIVTEPPVKKLSHPPYYDRYFAEETVIEEGPSDEEPEPQRFGDLLAALKADRAAAKREEDENVADSTRWWEDADRDAVAKLRATAAMAAKDEVGPGEEQDDAVKQEVKEEEQGIKAEETSSGIKAEEASAEGAEAEAVANGVVEMCIEVDSDWELDQVQPLHFEMDPKVAARKRAVLATFDEQPEEEEDPCQHYTTRRRHPHGAVHDFQRSSHR